MDYFVDAPIYGQGHSGQVVDEVAHLRNLVLHNRPTVACESGFNAGHSAAIWLEAPSTVKRLHSFDMGVEPYSDSSQAFIHALYPGKMVYHRGDSMKSLPKHSARVQSGMEAPCDIWYIDGGHTGKVPFSDLEHAWLSSHDGTIIVADDCTSRFQDVRTAWRSLVYKYGKIKPFNGASKDGPTDGSSGHKHQLRPPPGQPENVNHGQRYWRPYVNVVGIKGWCSGTIVMPADVERATKDSRAADKESRAAKSG